MPRRPSRVEVEPFVHVAARAQIQIFAMIDHRQVERVARTPWRGASRAHSSPAGHRRRSRRCRPSSSTPIAASSSPALSLVIAPMGKTLVTAELSRAVHDVAGDGGVVVHRHRVRHAADGGEASGRRGARAGFDGLGMLDARLAQMHVHVDEARRDDQAGGVEYLRAAESSDPVPTPAMRPSSIATSAVPSKPDAGRSTRPFLISSLAIGGIGPDDPFQHRHAHGDAILHLIQNHRALAVGHLGRQLAAAIDRARDASRWRPAWPAPYAPAAIRRIGNIRPPERRIRAAARVARAAS